MPFLTAEDLRNAMNTADAAIRKAVEDGDLMQVLARIRRDIVSFFLNVKWTG